jgi:hypothetical protein|nr:MAG TPA: hypothetical protein [Caudoviricetes sp.]
MARQFKNNSKTNYLGIRNSDGLLYTRLTEEGYNEEVKKGNTFLKIAQKDSKSPKYYHNTFPAGTETGLVSYLGINEVMINDKKMRFLVITIRGEEENDSISVPLRQAGSTALSSISKEIIRYLPAIDYTKPLFINSNASKNEKGKTRISVFFAQEVDGKKTYLKAALKAKSDTNPDGILPPPVQKEVNGEMTWDWSGQDSILYETLTNEIARFEKVKKERGDEQDSVEEQNTVSESVQNVSKTVNKTKNVPVQEEDEDDLPF